MPTCRTGCGKCNSYHFPVWAKRHCNPHPFLNFNCSIYLVSIVLISPFLSSILSFHSHGGVVLSALGGKIMLSQTVDE